MVKKKILIFIDWYKPGFKAGGPIRSISNLVSYLSESAHVYIVTRNTDYLESIPYSNINTNCWNQLDKSSVFYLSNNNTSYSTIKKIIVETKPNVVYCNSLYSPYFTLIPLFIAKKLKINSVLSVRGMLSRGSLAVKANKKKVFLSIIKLLNLFKNCTFQATSLEEKKDIERHFGTKRKIIVANNLPEKSSTPYTEKPKQENHLKLISIARIAPEKNTLYALSVLKNCKKNIEFDIYGPIYKDEYWMECQNIINQMPNNIVVNYMGVLHHEKVNETLQHYHAFFLPSTGENFGHSIIEAMKNSCVVILSDKTPWRELEKIGVGFDIPLDKQDVFSKKIDYLATLSAVDFNIYTKKTYDYIINKTDVSETLLQYKQLFQL
ncbi:MAG: glycosyltransferase [Flavobacteriales bacterium]|nr:glycosyltransferase [Flavobacteriales bacterium]